MLFLNNSVRKVDLTKHLSQNFHNLGLLKRCRFFGAQGYFLFSAVSINSSN